MYGGCSILGRYFLIFFGGRLLARGPRRDPNQETSPTLATTNRKDRRAQTPKFLAHSQKRLAKGHAFDLRAGPFFVSSFHNYFG
jgi:hypothetical protein